MKNIAVLLILLFTIGCDTDDTADVPRGMLTKMIVHQAGGGQYQLRYYYDGHKLDRTEYTSGHKEFYYYDGDLIVNVKRFGENALRFERQFFYDDSDRLVKTRFISYDDDRIDTADYTYNPDGTVTRVLYLGDTPPANPDYELLQFENGLIKQIDFYSDGQQATTIYTYDDKLAPEDGIVGFGKMNLVLGDAIRHNITAIDYTDAAGSESHHIGFNYNSAGKPVLSSGDLGLVIPNAESVEYFYK